jgi:hypothetical protein
MRRKTLASWRAARPWTKFRKLASDMAEGAQPLRFNGQEGLMLNAPSAFHSLLGELLSKQCGSFALLWSAGQGGVVKVGLRSQRGYDCIPLAHSSMGGEARAGLRVPHAGQPFAGAAERAVRCLKRCERTQHAWYGGCIQTH